MKYSEAKEIASDVLNVCEALNTIVIKCKSACSEEQYVLFRLAVATVVANLDLDILAKLYKEYPELELADEGLQKKTAQE